ncbi:MAG: response regulator [Planctomycetes bacterium]|nr:response regulator [Planctomycetota bacterium]
MAYNILIVDDSVLTRAAIKRIIDMVDLDVDEVLEAENGIEAFKVLESKNVDVVLADLNMPEMGGVELVHKMKSDDAYSDIPVIVVSTESSVTRIKELLSEGIKDFLHKPFSPEEFRATLAKNLEV